MTNGEIDRLGNLIRSEADSISITTLNELQNHRISHKDTLAKVFQLICKFSKSVNRNAIVTYRIKRIESIVGKLVRYSDMRFSRMWDVGGCRCILSSNDQIYRLFNIIDKSDEVEIRKSYDYIANPQDEGYKSLHLFLNLKNSTVTIELQLRNKVDHNWSTLVEISDLLYDSKLKEYKKDKRLLRFHYLLSKKNELDQFERMEIAKIIKLYKYFERLTDVFGRNYLEVRKQWLAIEKKRTNKYFLIESSKDKIPQISSYKDFDSAEKEYFKIYTSKKNDNVVLTHLPLPKYEQISIAYSNYLLTFHSFVDDCYELYESLIVSALTDRSYIKFFKYFSQYHEMSFFYFKNHIQEVNELNNFNPSFLTQSQLRKKKKEWVKDIQDQIKIRGTKNRKFSRSFFNKLPNSFIFKAITRRIGNKYNKRINKLLATTNATRQ
jgi:ppGpp synthetase/RelA/SpoT-type nucleotidyltranferase